MPSLSSEKDRLTTHTSSQLLIDFGLSEGLAQKIDPSGYRWHCFA